MRFFFEPYRLLWRHRAALMQTARDDIRARFAGSVLGLAWLILYPLLFLGAYALVYVVIFKVRFQLFNSGEYVVLIFCGLIPFLGIADALGTGVGSVTGNAHLIRNTLFPIELIPVKAVLASQCTQIVGLGMLLVVIGALGHLTLWAFLLPLAWLMTLLFTIGLLWILSSSNVLVRDLHNMVTIMVLVLMMVSPIAYTGDMVPERLQVLLGVNPLFYIITSYRDCLMLGRFPRGGALWVLIAMALVTFSGGLWFFTRIKKVVTDYV